MGLVPAGMATAWLGPRIAGFLSGLDPSLSGLLAVLGWAIAALVGVLGLAVVLWPLRVGAGYPTLSEEVHEIRQGGVEALLAQARAEEAKAKTGGASARRKHHLAVAAGTALLAVGPILITWGAWVDGRINRITLAVAVVAVILPAVSLYQLFRAVVPGSSSRS